LTHPRPVILCEQFVVPLSEKIRLKGGFQKGLLPKSRYILPLLARLT